MSLSDWLHLVWSYLCCCKWHSCFYLFSNRLVSSLLVFLNFLVQMTWFIFFVELISVCVFVCVLIYCLSFLLDWKLHYSNDLVCIVSVWNLCTQNRSNHTIRGWWFFVTDLACKCHEILLIQWCLLLSQQQMMPFSKPGLKKCSFYM